MPCFVFIGYFVLFSGFAGLNIIFFQWVQEKWPYHMLFEASMKQGNVFTMTVLSLLTFFT